MKKITLLVASIFLLGGGAANAAEKIAFSVEKKSSVDYKRAKPIVFIERGVEFFLFPDGQLDFNARPTTGRDMYYNSNSRRDANRTYVAANPYKNKNYGVNVDYDKRGRIKRVGDVAISYDSYDRVKRVGSVYMTYNRYVLEQVGGLKIIYNRRGQIVDTVGAVKGGGSYVYNQNNRDDDHYYYRTNGLKAKIEDAKLSSNAIVINRR